MDTDIPGNSTKNKKKEAVKQKGVGDFCGDGNLQSRDADAGQMKNVLNCWMLVVECCLLLVAHENCPRLLVVGCWMLPLACWWLDAT